MRKREQINCTTCSLAPTPAINVEIYQKSDGPFYSMSKLFPSTPTTEGPDLTPAPIYSTSTIVQRDSF